MQNGLNKKQHLCGETTIGELYKTGKAFISFPIRIVYRTLPYNEAEGRPRVRVMFAAPKKYFKHAVDRNRFKRLMREAYRLQQHKFNEILMQKGIAVDMSFSAVHNQLPNFITVKEKINRALQNITDHI